MKLAELSQRFVDWSIRRENAAFDRKRLRDFPIGSRVELTRGCGCSNQHVGKQGVVIRLAPDSSDYHVKLDEPRSKISDYEYVCAKGMRRL